MPPETLHSAPPPDSQHRGLVALLPAAMRPYALLARLDRPIGSWLLFWPCAWAVALAGGLPRDMYLLLLFGVGATAMRGAGCVYNDIVDRDLDAKVERTRSRPLPSGQVRVRAAWNWLFALCMIGLIVLIQLRPIAEAVAVASLAPVAAYPFMKRITWWPQAWLGIVFSWGALVGWPAVTGTLPTPALLLYAGCIAWVIGYDTLYALQDIEDDALAGIKSSARRMGARVQVGVALFYGIALLLWAAAFWMRRPDPLAWLGLGPIAAHLGWQVVTLDKQDAANALARFRANRFAGLLMLLGCWAVGSAG